MSRGRFPGPTKKVFWRILKGGSIVARDTVRFEVIATIIYGIGGTESDDWLSGTYARTTLDPQRWNSHTKNLVDPTVPYSARATYLKFRDGPEALGLDSGDIHNQVLSDIQGWASANNNKVRIAIAGWSRGALIASWVANDLSELGISVQVVGMFDPVDMSGGAIPYDNSRNMRPLVQHVVTVGGIGDNVDYSTWPRAFLEVVRQAGNTTTVITPYPLNASHGAIGGTPGYNDAASYLNPSGMGAEQDGSYSWTTDKNSSAAADVIIRAALIAACFGVEQLPNVTPASYGFGNNPDNTAISEPGNGPNL